ATAAVLPESRALSKIGSAMIRSVYGLRLTACRRVFRAARAALRLQGVPIPGWPFPERQSDSRRGRAASARHVLFARNRAPRRVEAVFGAKAPSDPETSRAARSPGGIGPVRWRGRTRKLP